METKNKTLNKLSNLLFLLSILFFTVGLNLQDNPPIGWYQQWLPYIDNKPIQDMVFFDSLTGLLCTNDGPTIDTNYILKTTNGGDNWYVVHYDVRNFNKLCKVNDGIVYSAAGSIIMKTTNQGSSWQSMALGISTSAENLYALNEDTIWITCSAPFDGGIFRTTNGGTSWTRITPPSPYPGGVSPLEIYMLDFNTGFYADAAYTYKTTNGGANWYNVSAAFNDIYFINSNTGWHCEDVSDLYKTTNAGENWEILPLPPGNDSIIFSKLNDFAIVNEDTIWGGGPVIFFNPGQFRGLIYITTDGGNTWGYQLPDTSIHIPQYHYTKFTDKKFGWLYHISKGVHTVTGGNDTTIYLKMTPLTKEIPNGYRLHQNYPNPFNYSTRIKFDISKTSYVTLKVYNLLGREVDEIVNSKVSAGSYDYRFIGSELSSGVYLCRLVVDDDKIDTKKMVLIK